MLYIKISNLKGTPLKPLGGPKAVCWDPPVRAAAPVSRCSRCSRPRVAVRGVLAKGLLGDHALQGRPNKALHHLLNFKHLTSSIEFNATAHMSEVKHMLKRFVGLGPKRLEVYKSSCDL